MTQHQQFHLDHAGHSITVNVEVGHSPEVELLVDGKEVGYSHEHGARIIELESELPEDPPHPFSVCVYHPRHGRRTLACALRLDGREEGMPERRVA
jgi:hypothetical protein